MDKYLAVYTIGGEIETQVMSQEYPDSSAPHIWGLPAEAIILITLGPVNPGLRCWIEEQEIPLAISPAPASE